MPLKHLWEQFKTEVSSQNCQQTSQYQLPTENRKVKIKQHNCEEGHNYTHSHLHEDNQ